MKTIFIHESSKTLGENCTEECDLSYKEQIIIRCNSGKYQCFCRNCGCAQTMFFDSPEEVPEEWNARPIENKLKAENEQLREALGVILDEAKKDEPCILAIKTVAYTALKGDEK